MAFGLSIYACESARALTITADFDSTITGDTNHAAIEAGINSAIATYETMFLNPINVTITFTEDPTGLGGSLTNYQNDTYTDYRLKLAASATSTSDTTALAHLPTQTKNPVNNNNNVTLATANAAALGIFVDPVSNSVGGQIFLNPSIMNLTRTSINPNKYDLIAVVEHELDEVLGLGSALVNGSNGQPAPTGPIMPMDLFRYNQSGVRSFNTGTDSTTQAYFSLDGTTHIARFNQTSDSSTGGDFGDWWSFSGTQTPEVQDAYGTPGIVLDVGTAEKTALDAIGYTLLTKFTWNATGNASSPVDGSQTWSSTTGSKWWSGTSNSVWKNSPVQNAQFGTPGTPGTTAYTVTLGTAITVGTMTFANQRYTIAAGPNALTINGGILAVADGTVASPVILGADNSWETVGTATLTVSGNVSGGFGITKQGPGTLIISGSNTYTGTTTVNSGILQLNSAGALPAGANVVVAGGALDIHGQTISIGDLGFGDGASLEVASITDSGATAGSLTLGGDVTYTGTFNGGFTYSSPVTIAHDIQLASGTHHFTSPDTALGNNYDIVISGALTGSGGVTKDGANFYMALTGANTYSGATVINAGFFYAAAANTLSSASAVIVNSAGVLSLNPTVAQTGVVVGDYNQTIGSLAGAGFVILDAATLTMGGDGTSTTFSGTISGTGGIVHKTGAGTLTLSGANTYTGNTFVDAGTILVSGSIAGLTRVNSGGTLEGTGTTANIVAVSGGTVLPGTTTGAGLLKSKSFTLSSGAHLSLELGGTTGTGTSGTLYSELKVTGTVALGGDVQFSFFGGYTPQVNDIFYIILNDGIDAPTGTFSNAVGGVITSGGIQYQVNYAANGDAGSAANDVSLKVIAVPEPGAGLLALTGLAAGLGGLRPRRGGRGRFASR